MSSCGRNHEDSYNVLATKMAAGIVVGRIPRNVLCVFYVMMDPLAAITVRLVVEDFLLFYHKAVGTSMLLHIY